VSYLIFCSFEVGGQPFRMAETLNRFGVEAYYVYLGKMDTGHDSTQFHYGNREEPWYLSLRFEQIYNNSAEVVHRLRQMKTEYHITHCLATGEGAYHLQLADISYHYWSFGSDLDYKCFIRTSFKNHWLTLRLIRHPFRVYGERRRARDSIRYSDSAMVSPYQIKALKEIFPDKKLFFLPHFFKVTDYSILLREKEINKRLICEKIEADRYFFSSARHCWTGHWKRMSDYKGNEVILHSYAKYLSLANNDHSKLVLVKKGPDVEASKYLSKKLEIEKRIMWVDEMKRDELDKYYQGADLCFGHFGTPVLTYAVLEALKNGTISISFSIEDAPSLPFYIENPPIFNSKSPEEIADFMIKILNDQARFNQRSCQSWVWVNRNCSEEKFVESFRSLFKSHKW
jgi:glycosyltransferase involved in cell wall biosynthesis